MLPHQFFKLLSDETRVRCLMLIVRQECLSVGELTQALQESQPKVFSPPCAVAFKRHFD